MGQELKALTIRKEALLEQLKDVNDQINAARHRIIWENHGIKPGSIVTLLGGQQEARVRAISFQHCPSLEEKPVIQVQLRRADGEWAKTTRYIYNPSEYTVTGYDAAWKEEG